MPLTRFEIRNEYSLANPDLYRAAAKDDPDGLLEGVAMAGLVGIVRQLGDLAEFAAEVFHDLHEEVLATASRGHELLIRVQQLEAEIPLVEKMMVAESNYVNFAYNPGVEWHANVHNDQNHFTQGDLPRFIRNAYEDCRGPPRLFLLDKFDVAGAGACLKRYTDPSFFRMEWASSELMKAEKEQQDKKARRNKKKGRRQRNGEIRDSFRAAQRQPRMHHVPSGSENTASTSVHGHILTSQHSAQQEATGSNFQGYEHQSAPSRSLIPEREGRNLKVSTNVLPQDVKLQEVSSRSSIPEPEVSSLKANSYVLPQEAKPKEVFVELTPRQGLEVNEATNELSDAKPKLAKLNSAEKKVADNGPALPSHMKVSDDVADDFASETDNYMDALTTMDSEVDTDLEVKAIAEVDGKLDSNATEGEAKENSISTCQETSGLTHFVTEDGASSSQISPEESTVLDKVEPDHVVHSPQADLTEEREPTLPDDICVSTSIQQRSSTPLSGSSPSTPLSERSVVKSEVLESESAEDFLETPEISKADESKALQSENLPSVFNQLPEPAVPLGNESQMVFPEHLGSLSAHLGFKTSVLIDREFSSAYVNKHSFEDSESEASEGIKDKHSFEDSESEASEGIKELSPRSSANSSIQPMKWDTYFSKRPINVLDSDDELEAMQVSSSSSTSSALSSPRPSTLATTFFNNDFDTKSSPLLYPQGSIKSSSESSLGLSPRSARSSAPHSPISLMGTGGGPSVISPHLAQTQFHKSHSYDQSASDHYAELGSESMLHTDMAVPAQNRTPLADEPDHFPPLPPLPPLEWRMTRRFSGISSSATNPDEVSARSPTSHIPLSRPPEFLQAFNPVTFSPLARQNSYTMPDEATRANEPPTTSQNNNSQGLSMNANKLEELSVEIPAAPQNLPEIQGMPMQATTSFSAKLRSPSNIPGRPDQLSQSVKSSRFSRLVLDDVPLKAPGTSTKEYTTSQSFTGRLNESSQPYRSFTAEYVNDIQNDSTADFARVEDRNVGGFSPPSGLFGGNPTTARSSKVCSDTWDNNGVELLHPPMGDEKVPSPSRPEETLEDPGLGSQRTSRPKFERKDSLIAAIAAHDKSSLRKVPAWSQSSRTPHSDDREGFLEQIRTGSFSLRHTNVKKREASRPVTNINVAAILEKANAIRQAFAGSDDDDEDDDWSD